MLSGDGNENGEKTTIGLINKKQLFTCSTLYCTFLCPCFARLQRETYVFSLTFFSLPFICALVAVRFLIFSPPLQIFHVGCPSSPLFFYLSV